MLVHAPSRRAVLLVLVALVLPTIVSLSPAANAETLQVSPGRLPQPLHTMTAVAVGASIYLVGGWNATGGHRTILRYDTATDTVTSLPAALPVSLGSVAAVTDGSKIYVFGGERLEHPSTHMGAVDTIYRFDPATNTVTEMTARLPSPRTGAGAVWYDGKAYVLGGTGSGGRSDQILRYDPAADTVTILDAKLPTPRAKMGIALRGTEVYILGGEDASGPRADILRWLPWSATVETLSVALPSARYSMATAYTGDTYGAYLFGGGSSTDLAQIVSFTPRNSHVQISDHALPSARLQATAAYVAPYVYVFGGLATGGITSEILKFDPDNYAPGNPFEPSPANGATRVSTRTGLRWEGSDPTGEAVTFDVYLDAGPTAGTLVPGCSGLATRVCPADRLNLQPNTQYAWRVTSRDARGVPNPSSATWTFATAADTPPNHPADAPIVRFTYRTWQSTSGHMLFVNPTDTTSAAGGGVWRYRVSWGDGTPDTNGTQGDIAHTYAAPGTYAVTVTATTDDNRQASATTQVTLEAGQEKTGAHNNRAPRANISLSTHRLNATADGRASSDPDGSIAQYEWTWTYPAATRTGEISTHLHAGDCGCEVRLKVTDNAGGTAITRKSFLVSASPPIRGPPSPAFTVAASNLTVRVDANASTSPNGRITTYDWKFIDEPQYGWHALGFTTPTYEYTYAQPGTYTIRLRVRDDAGQTAETTRAVTVTAPPGPVARFGVVVTNMSVRVDASASTSPNGRIATYDWKFIDHPQYGWHALGHATPHANYSYSQPGPYTIRLRVTDAAGRTAEATQTVNIGTTAPTPLFTAHVQGAKVRVDASASWSGNGRIVTYDWKFIDEPQYGWHALGFTTPTYEYTYAQPGTYTIRLRVTDNVGRTAETTRIVSVGPAPLPAPSFTTTVAGNAVRVDASASSSPNGAISSYDWKFIDQPQYGWHVLGGTSPQASYAYTQPGAYTIRLRVTDVAGRSAETTRAVQVGSSTGEPVPIFRANVTGRVVDVDATASRDFDGTITAYFWDWGDGSPPALGVTARHAYGSDGTRTIMLIVTDNDGRTARTTLQVRVSAPNMPPAARFVASADGLRVTVDASASVDGDGTIASYAWDWGDGTLAGRGVTATHAYDTGGAYPITLTVTDDRGATGTRREVVHVRDEPDVVIVNAEPRASISTNRERNVVTADGSASRDPDGEIVSYAWDWGDGSPPGEGVRARHAYRAAGEFRVALTVMDNHGATATSVAEIEISPADLARVNLPPMAEFTYAALSGFTVSFDGALSADRDGTIVSHAWDWGDGSPPASGAGATHVFATSGVHRVTLTVTDNEGATASITKEVTVLGVQAQPGTPTWETPAAGVLLSLSALAGIALALSRRRA